MLFADDVHFEDPVGAPPVLGKANLETFFRDTIGSGWDMPELMSTLLGVRVHRLELDGRTQLVLGAALA